MAVNQGWFQVGPPCVTIDQHKNNIGSTPHDCWMLLIDTLWCPYVRILLPDHVLINMLHVYRKRKTTNLYKI